MNKKIIIGIIIFVSSVAIIKASSLTLNLPIVDGHYYFNHGLDAGNVVVSTMITNGDRIRWWESTNSADTVLWGGNPTAPVSLPSYTTLTNATYTVLESATDCTTDLATCKSTALQWVYWNDIATSTPTSTNATSTSQESFFGYAILQLQAVVVLAVAFFTKKTLLS